jgi:acyl-coenzyme A synthetase/AMP-(fatty) acid ligase
MPLSELTKTAADPKDQIKGAAIPKELPKAPGIPKELPKTAVGKILRRELRDAPQ